MLLIIIPTVIHELDIISYYETTLGSINGCIIQQYTLFPPKRFDIFPPITGGCSEGLGVL